MKRWKSIVAAVLSLALCLSFTACAPKETEQAEPESGQSETKIITDAYGEQVEVPAQIDSIVATMWPIPSVVYAVTGRNDMIKTMAEGSMEAYLISMFQVMSPGLESIPTNCLDSSTKITFEELAKVEPDIVLCNQAVEEELGEQIRAIGAVPVKIKFGEFEDVQELIRILGELFDCEERAQELIDFQKETLSYLESKQSEQPADEEKPTVLYITRTVDNEYQVVCPKHLGAKMVELAGGRMVTEELTDAGTTTNVSIEQILAWNPDVIFLSNFDDFTPSDFTEGDFSEEWSMVSAVQNNRVYKTPIGLYRWDTQSVEAPLMVEWLAKVLNPEIYTEYDFLEELRGLYRDHFDYELTEADIARILNSDVNVFLDMTDDLYKKIV